MYINFRLSIDALQLTKHFTFLNMQHAVSARRLIKVQQSMINYTYFIYFIYILCIFYIYYNLYIYIYINISLATIYHRPPSQFTFKHRKSWGNPVMKMLKTYQVISINECKSELDLHTITPNMSGGIPGSQTTSSYQAIKRHYPLSTEELESFFSSSFREYKFKIMSYYIMERNSSDINGGIETTTNSQDDIIISQS